MGVVARRDRRQRLALFLYDTNATGSPHDQEKSSPRIEPCN